MLARLAGLRRLSAGRKPQAAKPAGPTPLVIPVPRDFARGEGAFRVAATTEVVYSGGAGAAEAASYFIEHLKGDPQLYLQPAARGRRGAGRISFVLDANAQRFGPRNIRWSSSPRASGQRARRRPDSSMAR